MATTTIKKDIYSFTDNGWIVNKYQDGTFEAWLPFSATSTTSATNAFGSFYRSDTMRITSPSFMTSASSLIDYRVNASFTSQFSFPLYWSASGGYLQYAIVSPTSISDSTYRLSAYMKGYY